MLRLWALLGRLIYYTVGVFVLPLVLNGSRRVRVAILSEDSGEIVLGKTWIGAQRWNLIGGGIMKNEDKFVAAVREIKEETGLDISTDQLEYIGEITEAEYLSTFQSHIFKVTIDRQALSKQKFELLELGWHRISKLPKPINMHTIKAAEIKTK